MAFHTEKESGGEKDYMLAKDVNTERRFEIKAKKIGLKKTYYLVYPNSGS